VLVPAVGCEVIVGDAGSPGGLLIGDVGRHQTAAVETHVSDGMPELEIERYIDTYIYTLYIDSILYIYTLYIDSILYIYTLYIDSILYIYTL